MIRLNQGREDLCRLWADKGYRKGAEIGVWSGEFSARICTIVKGVHLLCIDPWAAYDEYHDRKNNQGRLNAAYEEARYRLTEFDVTIFRMTSQEVAPTIPFGSLDFIYLDGNHSEPFITQDLEAWTPKVRSGGMVCGHDYQRNVKRPDIQVAEAVDRFTDSLGITSLFVFASDNSPSFAWEVA